MINEREIILDILLKMDSGEYSRTLIRDVLDKYDYLETRQKAFIKRVTEGTVERRITLDFYIDSFSKIRIAKMKPLIRNVLRMTCYQILYMDNIPDAAAINEAVRITGKRKFVSLKGFVNGVLRNISRNKDKLSLPERGGKLKDTEYLSVKYSMPELICSLWTEEYGFEQTELMLDAFMKVRPVMIRMDERLDEDGMKTLKAKIESTSSNIVATGNEEKRSDPSCRQIVIQQSPILPYAYKIEHTDNIQYLPGYDEGHFMVQDVSSMLVAETAGIKPDMNIVDVCAAPGGKSLHAAAKLKGTGRIICRDLSNAKCDIIRENVQRMKFDNITVEKHDATEHDDKLVNFADILLCDLPCSGLGIMGRKCDIRYAVSSESLSSVSILQKKIIEKVWDYCKAGGIMMYSTCTVRQEENELMVKWICDNFPFERVDISDSLPKELADCKTAVDGYIQIFPGQYDADGFFLAKLRRTK